MSLGRKVFAAPARLWLNWPLWGGLLAMLLLAKHAWVLFAPAEHAVPGTAATQSPQTEQLFGTVNAADASASLNGILPIGIFASRRDGFAILQTENGQVGVGLGGQVVPGVHLVETHADYVILERNGTRQRADLRKVPVASGASTEIDSETDSAANAPATQTVPALAPALNELTPEQRAISQLQQQQRKLIRGLH